jgi:hypothetical protein
MMGFAPVVSFAKPALDFVNTFRRYLRRTIPKIMLDRDTSLC